MPLSMATPGDASLSPFFFLAKLRLHDSEHDTTFPTPLAFIVKLGLRVFGA